MHDRTATKKPPPPTVKRTKRAVPRALQRYFSLDDFEATARRRLPKMLYGYIWAAQKPTRRFATTAAPSTDMASAAGAERRLRPRADHKAVRQDYAAPFGIPPMGSAALFAYRGDIVLTRAAAAMNVPIIFSASSLITLEDVRRENPNAWYQAYLAGEPRASNPWSTASPPPATRPSWSPPTPGAAQPREQHPQRVSDPARDHPQVAFDTRPSAWLFGAWAQTLMNHGMPHFATWTRNADRGCWPRT